jgi:type VI secretion system protein ImpC
MNPNVVSLAAPASLAVRIEPQLLRKLRLDLCPSLDAGTEADLWFSRLVETRTASGIVLGRSWLGALRARLARSPALLESSWAVVSSAHRHISPALFAEEQLTYLALSGRRDEMRRLLRSAIATMLSPGRRSLASWAASALERLPPNVRQCDEGQMLAFGASVRLNSPLSQELVNAPSPEWTAWLAPDDLETVSFGVALLEDAIEFGPPGRSAAHRIQIPRTSPIWVQVSWEDAKGRRMESVELQPNRVSVVDTGPGVTEIDIRTVLGEQFGLVAPRARRESSQRKLDRLRPPRVHITYEVETGGAIEKVELPFVVGVLANLAGSAAESARAPLASRRWLEINTDNFDQVLQQIQPRLAFALETGTTRQTIDLTFTRFTDFHAGRVAERVPALATLLATRNAVRGELETESPSEEDPGPATVTRLAEIDRDLSVRLRPILHHPEFQRLEATWRGLRYLVDSTETSDQLKIKVLNVKKEELHEDLPGAQNALDSDLFRRLSSQFATFGGDPFGALIGDFYFTQNLDDIGSLEGIAAIAAAVHAPFIAAAGPEMLSLSDFRALSPQFVARDQRMQNRPPLAQTIPRAEGTIQVGETPGRITWDSFRRSDNARYVALTLPRMLLRLPYDGTITPLEAFDFNEVPGPNDNSQFLWGNAAYAFAACLTRAFALHGWTAAIRGHEGGGRVEGLPFRSPGPVTEIAINDRTESELAAAGFLPLASVEGMDVAVFFSANSVQQIRSYSDNTADLLARLSIQLPYTFAVSRFAHYLRVLTRDKVGAFMSPDQLEQFLNRWISDYVAASDDDTQTAKAQRPLREARVQVAEKPGRPGRHQVVAFLRPRFQLEEPGAPLRIAFDLPAPAPANVA